MAKKHMSYSSKRFIALFALLMLISSSQSVKQGDPYLNDRLYLQRYEVHAPEYNSKIYKYLSDYEYWLVFQEHGLNH